MVNKRQMGKIPVNKIDCTLDKYKLRLWMNFFPQKVIAANS